MLQHAGLCGLQALTDDEDLWEDQRGKSLSRVAAFEAETPMRHPRATAASWPEARSFTNRPDIRSQSQPGSKKRLAIERSPYTPYVMRRLRLTAFKHAVLCTLWPFVSTTSNSYLGVASDVYQTTRLAEIRPEKMNLNLFCKLTSFAAALNTPYGFCPSFHDKYSDLSFCK